MGRYDGGMTQKIYQWLCTYKWWLLFGYFLLVGLYGAYKPLPSEIGMRGETYFLRDDAVTFLADETFLNAAEERVATQEIFDTVLALIADAEHYILIDMFLFNPFQGQSPETHRLLSEELTAALIAKKKDHPAITITVISDPINTVYGGQESDQFARLRAADIPVILTNHAALRDSNPLYSTLWRGALQWPDWVHGVVFAEPYTVRWVPNIMDAGGQVVPLRSYLKLFNFKANHRKLIVADGKAEAGIVMKTLVTSANPHDGSSMHGNVALLVEGGVWRDIVKSEQAVAEFSGGVVPAVGETMITREVEGVVGVTVLTEYAILEMVLEMLAKAQSGDTIDLMMFYLSEDRIIDALIAASQRGAHVRVMLDANKDAFGLEKNGVPNRPVAEKLVRETEGKILLRWCATHGEQCHSKMLLVATESAYELLLGSANFTRRNLKNSNLETNLLVSSAVPSQAYQEASQYFNRLWQNEGGNLYTHEYEVYKDDSVSKKWQSWFMENTGLSTF